MTGTPRAFRAREIRTAHGAPGSVACARRWIFNGMRWAAKDCFGDDGLTAVGAALSPEARHDTFDTTILTHEWLPEDYVMSWYEAVWSGPARRDPRTMHVFLDRMMDHGFGRVRKFLLGLATPELVAKKAAEIWQHDHNTGILRCETEPTEARFVLVDHAYVSTQLSRACITEILRYAVSLTDRANVRAAQTLHNESSLHVRVTWERR